MTPEIKARQNIDRQLEQCGWLVQDFKPGNLARRTPTWSEDNPDGRWRCYTYEELSKQDKFNLDFFWLKDESLEDSENLRCRRIHFSA